MTASFDLATSIKKTRVIICMIPPTNIETCLVSILRKSQSIDVIGSPMLVKDLGSIYNQLYLQYPSSPNIYRLIAPPVHLPKWQYQNI